jgi:hypothetical protein
VAFVRELGHAHHFYIYDAPAVHAVLKTAGRNELPVDQNRRSAGAGPVLLRIGGRRMSRDHAGGNPCWRTRRCALAAASLIIVLAGCGASSSKPAFGGSTAPDPAATFKRSFASVTGQFRTTAHEIGLAIQEASGQTDAQIGANFRQLAVAWQQTLSVLKTLKPPAPLASDFNTLADAATRAESDMVALVAAAETHSNAGASQASARLVTDIVDAKSASTRLTQRLGSP